MPTDEDWRAIGFSRAARADRPSRSPSFPDRNNNP